MITIVKQLRISKSAVSLTLAFLVVVALTTNRVWAQQPVSTKPDEESEIVMQDIPANLKGIAGLKAGMTMQQMVDLATEMTMDKRLAEASKVLVYVVRRDQDNLRAFNQLARVYKRLAEKSRETGSTSALQQAERYDSWAVGAYLEAAKIAYEEEDYTTAEELYNKVFMMDPANAECKLGLARVFSETGRGVQAQQHYKDYIKTPEGRQNSKAYLELAEIYGNLKSPFQRLSTLIEARDLDPENVEVLRELARAYFDRRQFRQATNIATKAVEKNPRDPECHFTLASILNVQDKIDLAEEHIRRAVELVTVQLQGEPDNWEMLQQLSKYYSRYSSMLRKKLRQDGENIETRILLAQVIREQANVERLMTDLAALSVMENASEEARENIRYLELLAELQHLTKKDDEASETCKKLLEKDPDNAMAQRILKSIQNESQVKADAGGKVDALIAK
jgi:tetratricopeptide (TPR) repeat protein